MAFLACELLTTITIPSKVKTISEDIFLWCHNLKTINLPDGLENIKSNAFCQCSSLETITIPSKVTSIGSCVFKDCEALTEIHCKAVTPPTADSDTFNSTPVSTCTLYVPTGSKSAYQTATGWKDFTNIVEE